MYGNTRTYPSNRASRAPVKCAAPQETEMNKIQVMNFEGSDVLEVKVDGVLTQIQPGEALDFDIERGAPVSVYVTDPEAAKAEFPKDLAAQSTLGSSDGGSE